MPRELLPLRRLIVRFIIPVLVCCLTPAHRMSAQVSRVLTVADSLDGAVGGVVVDGLGNIYAADFRDSVWRVTPDGRVTRYAHGFYGSSGNAIDSHGVIYQASFSGNYVSRIERTGEHQIFVGEGLSGPVGVAVGKDGELFVNNCRGNTVSRVSPEGQATRFAASPLFNCPNGLYAHSDGNLYVVNFSDGRMLRVDRSGTVTEFALIPGGGNGHIAFARGNFYVTAFQSHRIFKVSMDGEVELAAGTGSPGENDGAALEATFIFPNGIAASATGDRLFVNDFINRAPPTLDIPPAPRSSIRLIRLASISELMVAGLQKEGIEGLVQAYEDFKADPSTTGLFTEIEVNGLGYSLMQRGQLETATRVFELNARDYPNSFNVFDSLAEALMTAGRNDDAIRNYEKSLAINPGNQNAKDMIDKIRSGLD